MTASSLRRITPAELESVIAEVREEKHPDLALLGPSIRLPDSRADWPPELRGCQVFKLSQIVENVERSLISLANLRFLALRGIRVGAEGAKAIAAELKQLTSLDLGDNQIGDEGAKAIAAELKQLTSLDLGNNQIGAEGAKAIAAELKQLTSLQLGSNQIGDEGAKAIAAELKRLTSLQLGDNQIGDDGAKAIAAELKQLTSLDLGNNQIGADGAKAIAAELKQLTSLDLWSNQIGDEGAKAIAAELKQLTSLQLGRNQIGDEGAKAIAAELKELTSLLNLGRNQIGDPGAKAIAAGLKQLTSLQLGGNQIGAEGAKAIAAELKQLTSLELWSNQIGDEGAKAIAAELKQLTSLHLWGNQIGDEGAKAIAAELKQLTSLQLGKNRIGDEGATAIAAELKQLTSLQLGKNRIGDKGAKAIAAELKELTSLHLGSNQIGDEGATAIAAELKQLTSLHLGSNQIGDEGATAIGPSLRYLDILGLEQNPRIQSVVAFSGRGALLDLNLSGTGVTDLLPLRPWIEAGIGLDLNRFGLHPGIHVEGCPLVRPSPEVIQQGRAAVLNYFREIDRQGVDHLYEAKVLFVGEGGAGKTSLIRRLYFPASPLPGEDESTRGIEIHTQTFLRTDGIPFRLNIWDFGGQQIYHATHQFFLTKSSLYILLDDTRKDHKSVRDEGFKYWFEVVEAFGGKSPLLIFQNEKGGRSKTIDEAGIKGRFPNVLDTCRGNLAETGSAEALRRSIEYHVQRLPHVGEAVPKKWVAIRAAIEETARRKPYISQEEYFEIYGRHLDPDREKALFLSRYLHDLGVFLHFQDDLRLRKTVIIQNRWATEAVFRILDDEVIKANRGRFTLGDCARLWASSEYIDMHAELLALMEKFELCNRLADTQPESFLVPQLLSPSAPGYVANWTSPNDLVLSYRYEFLPRGLVSRLMVRLHRFVAQPELCWANGALFEHQGTQLLMRAEDSGDALTLRSRGKESQALMSVIASALDALNDSFRGLEGKVGKWVPCICAQCTRATTPELFEQQHLLQRKRDGRLSIECRKSYDNVSVLELLDGLRLEQLPPWAGEQHIGRQMPAPSSDPVERRPHPVRPPAQGIKIFLASSEELRADRDEFELYFRQQNDSLRQRGEYLEIVRWENFLDAMSETRLQDEYNKAVRNADIFVSLFMTKTGKYAEEEFDTAHRAFRETGKPRIFTFFKKAHVSASAEGLAAIATLVKFQEKLKGLGHFYTEYESAEHLKRLFGDQLKKLDAELG